MDIPFEKIKKLRSETGVGITTCKKALESAKGDIENAVIFLRKEGLLKANKRSDKDTKEGIVTTYNHNDTIGVIIKLSCETDFSARNEKFKDLAHNLALHIAASSPQYISKDDVPNEVIEKEKEIYRTKVNDKPKDIVEKILMGKLDKFYTEVCLLEQPFVKDDKVKIKDLISQVVAAIGEKIEVKDFSRISL